MTKRASVLAATVFARVIAVPLSAMAAGDTPEVFWGNGRISVHAEKAQAADVLKAIAAATGATLLGANPAGPVAAHDCDAEPLEDALRRLFPGYGFSIRYRRDDRVASIRLIAPEMPRSGDRADAPIAAAPPETAAKSVVLDESIAVRGRLGRRLGPAPSVATVMEHALTTEHGAERVAAMRAIARAAASEEELGTYLADAVGSIDDETLANAFPGVERRQVAAIAARLAAGTKLQDVEASFRSLHDRLVGTAAAAGDGSPR